MTQSPVFLSIRELGYLIRTRQVSPVELVTAFLDRLEAFGPAYNAVVTITRDLALDQARVAEKEILSGRYKGPLHGCSFYDNKKAGAKLNAMLEMGMSRPWPDALEALSGERQIDATAILDYFAPLKKWLDEQNKGKKVGW